MKTIEYSRFLPQGGKNSNQIHQLIECFREVFAESPWNEWVRCQKCSHYWGKKDFHELISKQFHCCGLPVVDFWQRHEVLSDILSEITENSSAYLALAQERVIGFCWGYGISLVNLSKKLSVSLEDLNLSPETKVAYQDEVGVLHEYRDKKIAKEMVRLRLLDFLEKGLEYGFVRTRKLPEPSTTYLWYIEKLGYKIAIEYPENDGRVILYRKLPGLEKLF